jgi:hypothetical protein
MQALPRGERQQQHRGYAVLDRQARAQIHIGAAPLLVHRAGAHPGQTQQHGAPGTDMSSHVEALANRKCDAGKTKREAEPLQWPHCVTEAEADERCDNRHGAENERDQPDVHAAGRRQVHRSELQRERERADHRTGQRRAPPRPRDSAQQGEHGVDRSGDTEAQHEQCEWRGVVQRNARCRIAGAPQQHEGSTQHAGRDAGDERFLSHGARSIVSG